MYLTKIMVNELDIVKYRLYDPYQWHVALWRCFNAKERSFIFRVDRSQRDIIIIMLSPTLPLVQSWGTWQTKKVPEGFYDKSRYVFSLRAYPAVKKTVFEEDGKTRKRQGIRVPRTDPEQWLKEKAERNGFFIDQCVVVNNCSQSASKGFQKTVDFEGVLTVINKELFRDAAIKGIGPSKAYGLGLLQLRSL